jgi:hypothetical protein
MRNPSPSQAAIDRYRFRLRWLGYGGQAAPPICCSESVPLITQGRYSVWFKTPIGEGAGVVEFGPDGKLSGGDTTFSYIGTWTQERERFKATISAGRFAPGPPGVFGMDAIDITVAGQSDGGASISCTGFAKQAPGLKLEVTLIRICDD